MPHPSPFSSSASKNTGDQQQLKQVLLRNRNYDATKKKWSSWNKVLTRQSLDDQQTQEPFVYNFTRGGGQLVIHANMLSTSRQRAITDVLMECDNFREYSIQGGPEPRVHFLLHEEATNDFDGEAQPGYCYASIRMKSRPLQEMPEILELSADMQNMYPAVEGCFWNIGVNPILYRDGRDRIGYHADDDQDEQLILTVLVSSPVNVTRRISIRHRLVKTEGIQDGDEELELMLDAGDAYSMDGEMQKHYVHSVPSDNNVIGGEDAAAEKRISIVFRRGRAQNQTTDTGRSCPSLLPRVRIPYLFGNCIEGLHEGCTYTRLQLFELCAHRAHQRGVSGNKDNGCDSIIVSGLRPDGLGTDMLFKLMYAASSKEGALSILRSKVDCKPIRVFRSTVLKSAYKAICEVNSVSARYRFDGLYWIDAIKYQDEVANILAVKKPAEHLSSCVPATRIYLFYLARVERGDGVFENRVPSKKFLDLCVNQKSMSAEALLCRQGTVSRLLDPYIQNLESTTRQLNVGHTIPKDYCVEDFIGAKMLCSILLSTNESPCSSPGLSLLLKCMDNEQEFARKNNQSVSPTNGYTPLNYGHSDSQNWESTTQQLTLVHTMLTDYGVEDLICAKMLCSFLLSYKENPCISPGLSLLVKCLDYVQEFAWRNNPYVSPTSGFTPLIYVAVYKGEPRRTRTPTPDLRLFLNSSKSRKSTSQTQSPSRAFVKVDSVSSDKQRCVGPSLSLAEYCGYLPETVTNESQAASSINGCERSVTPTSDLRLSLKRYKLEKQHPCWMRPRMLTVIQQRVEVESATAKQVPARKKLGALGNKHNNRKVAVVSPGRCYSRDRMGKRENGKNVFAAKIESSSRAHSKERPTSGKKTEKTESPSPSRAPVKQGLDAECTTVEQVHKQRKLRSWTAHAAKDGQPTLPKPLKSRRAASPPGPGLLPKRRRRPRLTEVLRPLQTPSKPRTVKVTHPAKLQVAVVSPGRCNSRDRRGKRENGKNVFAAKIESSSRAHSKERPTSGKKTEKTESPSPSPFRAPVKQGFDAECTTVAHVHRQRKLRSWTAHAAKDGQPTLPKPLKSRRAASPTGPELLPKRRRSPRLTEVLRPLQTASKPRTVKVTHPAKLRPWGSANKHPWGSARTHGTSRLHQKHPSTN